MRVDSMAARPISVAIRSAKKAFRAEMKQILSAISPEERQRQSAIITKKLLCHERFRVSHRVSIYLSVDREVSTLATLREVLINSDKDCFIPKYDAASRHMDMVKLHSMADFENLPLTKWNIKQPADDDVREEALESGGLDLMIVPGLAFTESGQRLGSGRGYYDAYSDRCQHDPHGRPYTIAIAFKQQICRSLPMDIHDVEVDEVIFPDDDDDHH